jgi:hypothetical protein
MNVVIPNRRKAAVRNLLFAPQTWKVTVEERRFRLH